ncbi:MAG: SPFH domain-containing protein [Planctomycetota bacterium]
MPWVIAIVFAAIIGFSLFLAVLARYKRCPSDQILVIYGKVGQGQSARCIHGGAAFIWPVFQGYRFLDLTPITMEVQLEQALSQQRIRVDVPSNFTVGIATEATKMQNAAERLLGLSQQEIQELARDIIVGQLRLVIASMSIEEINNDRDRFMEKIASNVENELEKIGLRLINVNIKDITDESGYIDALGKKAASEAINRAKVDVSEKDRDGAIGSAEAQREQVIKVAEAQSAAASGQAAAERDKRVNIANANATAMSGEAGAEQLQRINIANAHAAAKAGEAAAEQLQRVKMADANARAVEGENLAAVAVAKSTADMREQKAEAERRALTAEKVKTAKALQDAYQAQREAETARAERERATQQADIIVQAEIAKRKAEIDADAVAERIRREARGQADAIFAKMEAQARGIQEILDKQAAGFNNLVRAAGNDPQKAVMMMIADKLLDLVAKQVEAIKNIKIDKVTVWDSGPGRDGKTSTANFLAGLMGSVPPLQAIFEQAGMDLPGYFGKKRAETEEAVPLSPEEAQAELRHQHAPDQKPGGPKKS